MTMTRCDVDAIFRSSLEAVAVDVRNTTMLVYSFFAMTTKPPL
jgi:hypothetical protein